MYCDVQTPSDLPVRPPTRSATVYTPRFMDYSILIPAALTSAALDAISSRM
jgi:hypothetical protein